MTMAMVMGCLSCWGERDGVALVEMLVVAVAGTVDDSETVVEKVGGIDALSEAVWVGDAGDIGVMEIVNVCVIVDVLECTSEHFPPLPSFPHPPYVFTTFLYINHRYHITGFVIRNAISNSRLAPSKSRNDSNSRVPRSKCARQ